MLRRLRLNIFVLDKNPQNAALYHADKHIVKMVLETAQLLSTAVRFYKADADYMYKTAYVNHPCAKWARASRDNFHWLTSLGLYLFHEYNFRYGKDHKSGSIIRTARMKYENIIPAGPLTPFAQAMPDEYKNEDAVKAYRAYYRGAKAHLLNYTRRLPPKWIADIATYKEK